MRKYTIFRLYSKIRSTIANKILHERGSSAPYITGDGFRCLAQHVYDYDSAINPAAVKEGDIVFTATELVPTFFKYFHPYIQHRYVLITHNSDIVVDDTFEEYLDDKIIHWFAENSTYAGPRITPVPIGIANKYHHRTGITLFFDYFKRTQKIKNKILYGFSVITNPRERTAALAALEKTPMAEKISGFPEPYSYFKLLSGYKFVASPPGNCPDTHRMWEALYLRTIPIVKRSHFFEYFESCGLPFWILDDWSELSGCSENELSKKYDELISGANWEALQMSYWEKKIKEVSAHGAE